MKPEIKKLIIITLLILTSFSKATSEEAKKNGFLVIHEYYKLDSFEPDGFLTYVYDNFYRLIERINHGPDQKVLEKKNYFYEGKSTLPFKTVSTAFYDPKNPEKGVILHKYPKITEASYIRNSYIEDRLIEIDEYSFDPETKCATEIKKFLLSNKSYVTKTFLDHNGSIKEVLRYNEKENLDFRRVYIISYDDKKRIIKKRELSYDRENKLIEDDAREYVYTYINESDNNLSIILGFNNLIEEKPLTSKFYYFNIMPFNIKRFHGYR